MPTATSQTVSQLQRSIAQAIYGKEEAIQLALITLLARGHLLIEDVPGVGKTTLAQALAKSFHCSFQRIQFTSDLLPSDVLGVSVYNPESREFEFRSGPIFANVVLADEINRTTPRTQSALLEAMNEAQVTVDGKTLPLPQPFLVIATQNPVELGFGKRVGAVMLDGILRGDDEKWLRQRKRLAVDGDLRFVHGFEKRGLRARRCAVDFVGENDVCKNRPGTEFKFARLRIVDAHAEHVAGQQVGGELDALEAAMKGFSDRLREGGLTDAGHVFNKQVAAREQRDRRKLNRAFFALVGAPKE